MNAKTYYDTCTKQLRYTKGQRSILEYIKILNLNSQKYSIVEKNPYLILPKNLLIYNTCYPIVRDVITGTAICAKNSVGIQIRIYALNIAEFASHATRDELYKQYDVWRELLFYEKIREDILKKKICPHFPILYGYFTSPNEDVDFFKLSKNTVNERDRITKEYQTFLFREGIIKPILNPNNRPQYVATPRYIRDIFIPLPDEIDPKLQRYSGQCLVLLTESSTYNIYMWASRQYDTHGVANKMTNHGFHREYEWSNVFFQLGVACAVMQKYKIYVSDMSLKDNVYIKDLHLDGNNMGYWRYVIDGISYYLPNIGYLLMVDSNFKDKNKDGLINENTKRNYKITIGDLFEKNDPATLDNMIYENFKNLFNPNNFSQEYLSNNVNQPPDEIMTMLGNIQNETEKNINKIVAKYFPQFLHDRIGTNLNDKEIPNLKAVNDVFRVGELVALIVASEVYVWVMVDSINTNNQTLRVFNRETNPTTGIISSEYRDIPMSSVKQYPSLITIDHVFKAENRIVDSELLETYIINI